MATAVAIGKTKKKNGKSIDQEVYERQARICQAFANATRIHLLDIIANGEYPAADLQSELSITKANLSQHIKILRNAGVVSTRREGKQIYCSLAIPEVKQACQLIRKVLKAHVEDTRKLVF